MKPKPKDKIGIAITWADDPHRKSFEIVSRKVLSQLLRDKERLHIAGISLTEYRHLNPPDTQLELLNMEKEIVYDEPLKFAIAIPSSGNEMILEFTIKKNPCGVDKNKVIEMLNKYGCAFFEEFLKYYNKVL